MYNAIIQNNMYCTYAGDASILAHIYMFYSGSLAANQYYITISNITYICVIYYRSRHHQVTGIDIQRQLRNH